MKARIEIFLNQLNAPADTASLVLVRVVFGLLMFWSTISDFYFGWVTELYAKPQFHFQYEWFQWVTPFPEGVMYIIFGSQAVFSLMIALGLYYRVSAFLYYLGYTYIFLVERTTYNNHFYLICLLSFMLILAPLNRSWSLDVLRGSVEHTDSHPVLWLWILRLHMGIVYFYGGLAKLDPDWLSGLATRKPLGEANRGTFLEPLFQYEFTSYFYAWSGMLFDLFIPFLMLWKKSRNLAFVAVFFFHFNNNFVFTIGIFPILALTLTMIYYEAGFPRKLVPRQIKKMISREYRKRINAQEGPTTSDHRDVNPVLLIFLGIYFMIQMLVPLRHLAYPGWTTWHEQGHDFAWRMMLRQKKSIGQFIVIHPETGEQRYADPADYLNNVQLKFMGNPRTMLQFVHHLDQLVKSNAGFDPIIKANYEISLNGREPRALVDPAIDLTKIPVFEPSYRWVIPFGER